MKGKDLIEKLPAEQLKMKNHLEKVQQKISHLKQQIPQQQSVLQELLNTEKNLLDMTVEQYKKQYIDSPEAEEQTAEKSE